MGTPRLITIPFSHYCEKARWGLAAAGLPYREDRCLPGLHQKTVRRHGGKRTVPLLVAGGTSYLESTAILKYGDAAAPAERKLYPQSEDQRLAVEALVSRFDERLGPASRLLIYYYLLPHVRRLVSVVGKGYRFDQRLLLHLMMPKVAPFIMKHYRINDASAQAALATIADEFRVAQDLLAGGRRFLVGERLSAADITFAALAAPVLLPAGHPTQASETGALPPVMKALVEDLRQSVAGRYVQRLYLEDRIRT